MAGVRIAIGQTVRFGAFTDLVGRLAGPDAPHGRQVAALVDRLADLIDAENVVRGVQTAGRCDLDLTPDAAAWLADALLVLDAGAKTFAPPPPLGRDTGTGGR
jgi:hypothetical protein